MQITSEDASADFLKALFDWSMERSKTLIDVTSLGFLHNYTENHPDAFQIKQLRCDSSADFLLVLQNYFINTHSPLFSEAQT